MKLDQKINNVKMDTINTRYSEIFAYIYRCFLSYYNGIAVVNDDLPSAGTTQTCHRGK